MPTLGLEGPTCEAGTSAAGPSTTWAVLAELLAPAHMELTHEGDYRGDDFRLVVVSDRFVGLKGPEVRGCACGSAPTGRPSDASSHATQRVTLVNKRLAKAGLAFVPPARIDLMTPRDHQFRRAPRAPAPPAHTAHRPHRHSCAPPNLAPDTSRRERRRQRPPVRGAGSRLRSGLARVILRCARLRGGRREEGVVWTAPRSRRHARGAGARAFRRGASRRAEPAFSAKEALPARDAADLPVSPHTCPRYPLSGRPSAVEVRETADGSSQR